jgi:acyl carrier protein
MTESPLISAGALGRARLFAKIRTLVAEHLGVDVGRITADSHFEDDFGLDPLDVLELTIFLEEQFPQLEVAEDRELLTFDDLMNYMHFVDEKDSGDENAWAAKHGVPQKATLKNGLYLRETSKRDD